MMPTATPETRTVRRFAFVPTKIDTGEWIVWERYDADERFESDYSGWSAGLWVTVTRRAIADHV